MDSIAAKIASVRKSAAADQQELARKCEEIIKEVLSHCSVVSLPCSTSFRTTD